MIVFWQPVISRFVAVSMIPLQLFRLSYLGLFSSTTMDMIPGHAQKGFPPILVTLLGITTDVKEEQDQKAAPPILVTLLGMVTEVKEEQSLKA